MITIKQSSCHMAIVIKIFSIIQVLNALLYYLQFLFYTFLFYCIATFAGYKIWLINVLLVSHKDG